MPVFDPKVPATSHAYPIRFILVRNALTIKGWEVLMMPCPTRDKQDRWYSSVSDARIYASGLQAASGWSILDTAQEEGGRDALASLATEEALPLLKRMGVVYAAFRLWGYITHWGN